MSWNGGGDDGSYLSIARVSRRSPSNRRKTFSERSYRSNRTNSGGETVWHGMGRMHPNDRRGQTVTQMRAVDEAAV